LLRYPAAQLFKERVAARGVVLADDETPLVAEMCRRLDGLPLAIELVARQVAMRGVRNTAACLVELLNFSDRTASPRHRTLKAALDWSYDLLSAPERIVFRRIVPFVGYFTLEGAQYVAGEFAAGRGEIFDAIAGLAEKSLIMTRLVQGQPQYRLLDTTRAYALEKLEEHAESDAIYLLLRNTQPRNLKCNRRHGAPCRGPKQPQPIWLNWAMLVQRLNGALGLMATTESQKDSQSPWRRLIASRTGLCPRSTSAPRKFPTSRSPASRRWARPVGSVACAVGYKSSQSPTISVSRPAPYCGIDAKGVRCHEQEGRRYHR
jgi:hypothetical protein